jgi:hypothetical protein
LPVNLLISSHVSIKEGITARGNFLFLLGTVPSSPQR